MSVGVRITTRQITDLDLAMTNEMCLRSPQVRLLVTHGIGFLPQCDVIVVMSDGDITEVGTYTELIDNDGAFAQFLHTYQNVEDNEEGDPGN